MKCPECGSTNLVKFGKKFAKNPQPDLEKGTGKRHLVQQYQCKGCGRITVAPILEDDEAFFTDYH